jgi:hypothetical protein
VGGEASRRKSGAIVVTSQTETVRQVGISLCESDSVPVYNVISSFFN